MTIATEKSHYLRQFDKLTRPAPFQDLRQAARARFRELNFPTPKTEDWRFTNIAPLLKIPFEPAADVAIDKAILPPMLTPQALRLVFVNGVLAPKLCHGSPQPGIEVGSLNGAGPELIERLKTVLGLADFKSDIFTALNTSFLPDGAFILVGEGRIVAEPVEVIYLSAPGERNLATYPRTVIVAEKRSHVTVVERFLQSGGTHAYFTNAVTEIALAERAIVDHYKVQNEGQQAFHIANTQVAQAAGSNFTTHYLSLGGDLVRNEVRVRFDGEACEATVNGLYLGQGSQHSDNFTVIDHAKPRCNSHELYKGILNDKAQGVFNGKIFVRPDAQKTDAKQTNKVLLLSDGATINTKPQLEIFADDVKCTHGATVGQLDAESIFYLRSRGIGSDEARALLTFAFANDIVGRFKIESLRAELEEAVLRR
jgi:Fe-S cluster assembly protein SufD